ncbi:UDP-N-acetylglucosamine 1-carboxyvinyltransferase [Dethiobacter alkaliphilus]|uniref:UDP-N-acetylglucosamine 1-carboxyvinyltransferase n=1 Tax=Dethiobacter alkaliphilus AHT 1 TaxID=555088 RepID=C0GIA6_DETAL|nr:UDP-N-acetylglucosamine 1-carboxyvinyltransferase [Dethiobacter alkaliphilus]EEG76954.1 UDP-N-acetylglucosamine 1-carboxyvinyltransferase [Dethiobacter alkaliphilus AHT 1]
MPKLLIKGNRQPLQGEVKVSGAKNAAVAIIPAAILTAAPVRIENLPEINDIKILVDILDALGVKTQWESSSTLLVDASTLKSWQPPYDLVKKLRASYYLIGALVGRFGKADVPIPGGCDLGPRPIDQHIKGLAALGAQVDVEHGLIRVEANHLTGTNVYLDVVSVGATINIMLAAVRARGKTIIENAAKEPEIVDVANFLTSMGAKIRGAGTDVIKITGVDELGPADHCVIPDRIEAGTYMIAAAATGGNVLLRDVIPKHLDPITAKLREMHMTVDVTDDQIRVVGCASPQAVDIKTFPYPGFPTDLQSQAMVLLTQASGSSVITENVFEGRFKHVDELKRMGARIKVEGRTAIIDGCCGLSGAPVRATDLRAGASFIIAGLIAEGDTVISEINHIYRGYEKICDKLNALGASIQEIE